jgi:hypothetical protein
MTQPTNGPTNSPGAVDPKKNAGQVSGRPDVASKTQPPIPADGKSACTPNASDAAPRAKSVDPKADDARDAAGSRSPGSLPEQMVSTNAAEKKRASSDDKNRPQGQQSSSSSKSSNDVRTSPIQTPGVHQSKDGGSGPTSAPRPTNVGDKNQPSTARAGSSPASVPANAPFSKHDLTSPQDPKPVGTTEPIQPNRPKPIQPSRVTEPTVGATGSTGVISDGDED